jgi:hypothetical protein
VSAATAAAAGRREAERLMVDECEIREPSTTSYNPVTHADDETPGRLLYAGRCKVRPPAAEATGTQTEPVGETRVASWAYVVSIPFAATHQGQPVRVPVSALVKFTASADASLVGQRVRVAQVPQGTYLTARRLVCEVYGR